LYASTIGVNARGYKAKRGATPYIIPSERINFSTALQQQLG
jgi:hypothetical protein